MRRTMFVILALALALPLAPPMRAGASDAKEAPAADILHYTARLHGIALLDIAFCLRLGITDYEASLAARTLGLAELLAHGRIESHVEGSVEGMAIRPRAYAEHGRLAGDDYAASIDYPGGHPVVRTLLPPAEKTRLPVPAADVAAALDGLSALALQSLVATRTGACDGEALIFDGRQLRRLVTHNAGHDLLPPGGRSSFAGTALACETVSVMLAGFVRTEPQGPQSRPRHSKSWLASVVPGGPAVPVRLVFDADALGDIVVDLDSASAGAASACDR